VERTRGQGGGKCTGGGKTINGTRYSQKGERRGKQKKIKNIKKGERVVPHSVLHSPPPQPLDDLKYQLIK